MLGTGLADCLDVEADALVLLDVADDSNRLRAWGLPAGPNMRMRLLGCLLVVLTFHLSHMRAPTKWRNPRYLLASLSNREKMWR